jgi:hypothetical protein
VPQPSLKPLPAGRPSSILLQVLYLHKNKLDGSLPAAWAGMESLQDLTLNENKLTGAPTQLLVDAIWAASAMLLLQTWSIIWHAWWQLLGIVPYLV